jgi:Phosphodiester glycosidase
MSGSVPEDAHGRWPGGQPSYAGPSYGEPPSEEPPQGGSSNGGRSRGRQGARGRRRKVRFRRLRRFARRPTVRVIGALFAVFLIWVAFSVGQALTASNGLTASEKLAEWARDHYLGPVVTFGEWLTYSPPKVGGKPSFSLAVPSGEAVSVAKPAKIKHHHQGFQAYIPAPLKSLAGGSVPGEGQWRVVEKVNGEPAIFATFLRDATYTSYVNGIASMDQRLVKFQLRPGAVDPGSGNWGAQPWIPPGDRTGLLATFNGGFRLNSSEGGWYLNGHYDGSLVWGAASVVYYKNGMVKIGEWGRDFHMNKQIEGVRQNLKLLVDHGKVSSDANAAVQSNWGATLGGGDYVWRSGVGITKNGRIIFVYGPALDAQDLAQLMQRAGVVEGMEMDINPAWMNFEYYQADGHVSDPTPVPLLPTQQPDPYRYYSVYSRDFTAVYAR